MRANPTAATLKQRQALLPVVAAAFKRAGTVKERPLERQFERMARAMASLAEHIDQADGDAHAQFAAQATTALQGLAQTWRHVGKKPGPAMCSHASAAADHLDALADALLRAAQGIRAPRAAPAAALAEVAALLQAGGEVIFALALAAEQLREAAGVSAPIGSTMVALPAPTACGCAAAPALVASDTAPGLDPHGSAAPPWLVARRGRVVVDAEALACVIDAMPVTVARLAGYFTLWQPQLQVRWDFCCRNWCLIVWWETFISSVTVRVNAGGVVNTRAQAIAAARQRAAAVIARLAPPAAPC